MGKLFGTDGIRGVANQYPITCEIALATGRAVGRYVLKNHYPALVIGRDTRISGGMLESALAAGAASTGCDVWLAGVIPTPGIAFLCTAMDELGAGIMVSASHNPYEDNGIKIFKRGGIKLTDAEEQGIESEILDTGIDQIPSGSVGQVSFMADAGNRYARFLTDKFDFKKSGSKLKIVVDCSNGAASEIAPKVFQENGFETTFIHHQPDGKNINHDCGSQHTRTLAKAVVKLNADIGLAFDGDADRLIAVDENGMEITGDRIIAVCADHAKARGQLKRQIVVSTIMSNVGLSEALEKMQIQHLKTGVGDRKVLEEMQKSGASIGGEDSGHMIFLEEHSTGDGMLSALKLLEVLAETKKKMSELSKIMTVYPQILKNIEVDASRPDYMQNQKIAETIQTVETDLKGKGRVLIRYSGTQPLLRVMVEGPDQETIENHCRKICDVISANL